MIIFWLPVVAAALAGPLFGGSLHNLPALQLRHFWLVFVVATTHIVFVFMPPRLPEDGGEPLRLLVPLGAWAMALFAALNLRVPRLAPGMALVLVGAVANALVTSANGGLMPVSEAVLQRAGKTAALDFGRAHPGARLPRTKDVLLEPQETKLFYLSDVLVTPPLPPVWRVWFTSPGDVALAVGLALTVVVGMRPAPRPAARKVGRSAAGPDRKAEYTPQQEAARGAADTIPPWARASALRARRADWLLSPGSLGPGALA